MAKKKKYYVVWEGHNPGVYDNWNETLLQVKAFPNAKYKSYPSREEAEQAYSGGYEPPKPGAKGKKSRISLDDAPIKWNSLSVDAACSGNPGDLEYRGVYTRDGAEIFRQGPFKMGTNNIGEFLALVHALALLKKKGDAETPIYSDSRIAMGWVKAGKARTKLTRTRANAPLFELIKRAEAWLKTNSISNPILKWETKEWGEIPADFGRK